ADAGRRSRMHVSAAERRPRPGSAGAHRLLSDHRGYEEPPPDRPWAKARDSRTWSLPPECPDR
ncbi:hypothetical protein ABTL12_19575, partial [Acinetobacter baumannii]